MNGKANLLSSLKKIPDLAGEIIKNHAMDQNASSKTHDFYGVFRVQKRKTGKKTSTYSNPPECVAYVIIKKDLKELLKRPQIDDFTTFKNLLGEDFTSSRNKKKKFEELKKCGKIIYDWHGLSLLRRAFSMFLVEEFGSIEKQKKPMKKGRENDNALSSEESNSDLDDDFDDLNLGSSSSNSNLSKDAADDSTFSHSNRSNKRHNQFYLNPNTTFHFHSTTLPNGAISDLADPDKYPYNQIKVAKKDFKNKNLSVNQCLKFQSTKNDKLSETDKLTFSQLLGFQKRILSIIVEPIYLNSFSFELSRRDFEDKDEIKNRLELITDLCLSRGEFIKYQEKLKTQVKYQNDLVELKDRLLVFLKVDNEKSSVGEYLRSSVGEGDFIVGFGDWLGGFVFFLPTRKIFFRKIANEQTGTMHKISQNSK